MGMDLDALKTELTTDPSALGYSTGPFDDHADYLLITTTNIPVHKPFPASEFLKWAGDQASVLDAIYTGQTDGTLSGAQRSACVYFMQQRDDIDVDDSRVSSMIDKMVTGGVINASQRTSLKSFADVNISRAEELDLGSVKTRHITAARAH